MTVEGSIEGVINEFKGGSVISLSTISRFVANNTGIEAVAMSPDDAKLDVYMYGGEQVQVLGAPTHKLTVTATVTNNSKANVILKGTKEGALPVSDEIELTSGEPKEIQGIEGYSYTWELVSPYTWTSVAPEAFVCTEDKDIALAISFPVA